MPESDSPPPPSDSPPPPLDLSAVWAQYDAEKERKVAEEKRRHRREAIIRTVRDHIQFRLLGYDLSGRPVDWDEDMPVIQALERNIVLNPQKLKDDLQFLRQQLPVFSHQGGGAEEEYDPDSDPEFNALREKTYFEKNGGHVYPVTEETLWRVRREGWILLAGLAGKNVPFTPLAYNIGLDSMPKHDQEFANLSFETLPHSELTDAAFSHLKATSVNWRTGVLRHLSLSTLQELGLDVSQEELKEAELLVTPESTEEPEVVTRRLGVGTALKYIITRLAHLRQKTRMTFNIGTISDARDPRIKLRNAPSFFHNSRIFTEDFGYRRLGSDIVLQGKKRGEREQVARVHWRARGGLVREAIANLLLPSGVLVTKGWDTAKLERAAQMTLSQIRDEQVRGEHR